jgi:uncharacterized protein YpmS
MRTLREKMHEINAMESSARALNLPMHGLWQYLHQTLLNPQYVSYTLPCQWIMLCQLHKLDPSTSIGLRTDPFHYMLFAHLGN